MRKLVALAAAAGALAVCGGMPAHAERIVLAPGGLVAAPGSVAAEYVVRSASTRDWFGWVRVGAPRADLGVELELERHQDRGVRGTSLSAQYSVTGNAFSDIAPAISVGMRDVLNEGREGRAVFLSLTKTLGLSRSQERLVSNVRIHAGAGSSHMDGLFAGITARLACGPEIGVEVLRRRANASVSLRVLRYGELRAYSLDGRLYFGGGVRIGL